MSSIEFIKEKAEEFLSNRIEMNSNRNHENVKYRYIPKYDSNFFKFRNYKRFSSKERNGNEET